MINSNFGSVTFTPYSNSEQDTLLTEAEFYADYSSILVYAIARFGLDKTLHMLELSSTEIFEPLIKKGGQS